MKKNWITISLVGVGAFLLLFSTGIEPKAAGGKTLVFKIIGLILLMIGLYRASRVKKEVFGEEEILEEETEMNYKIEEADNLKDDKNPKE